MPCLEKLMTDATIVRGRTRCEAAPVGESWGAAVQFMVYEVSVPKARQAGLA